jgi:hypothetical protein
MSRVFSAAGRTQEAAMAEWRCTVEAVNSEYRGDLEDLADRLQAALSRMGGSVMFGDYRLGATFTVVARLVLQATETARRTWTKALDDDAAWSIVSLTVRRTDQPDDLPGTPELLGITEVAQRLDVSKQRATELARTNRVFPLPLADLASGPVWTAWQISTFERSWARRPGRPPGSAAGDGDGADDERDS